MPKSTLTSKAATTEVTAEDAKRSLGELLSRAGFAHERIVITRHGKRIAALISIDEFESLKGAA